MAWFKATVTQEMALRLHETKIAVSADTINDAYEKVKSWVDRDGLQSHIDCVLVNSHRVCNLTALGNIDILLS
jgi:hypothetical protein